MKSVIGKLKFYVLAFGAVVLAIFSIHKKGEKVGKQAFMVKQQMKTNQISKEVREIEKDINKLSNSDVHKRLRDKWQRGPK